MKSLELEVITCDSAVDDNIVSGLDLLKSMIATDGRAGCVMVAFGNVATVNTGAIEIWRMGIHIKEEGCGFTSMALLEPFQNCCLNSQSN